MTQIFQKAYLNTAWHSDLLQIVMVSAGTHLVKNHESQYRNNESQFKNES